MRPSLVCPAVQDAEVRGSLKHRYAATPPPAEWHQLCRSVSVRGGQAVDDALSWRQHVVPDIEGSKGLDRLPVEGLREGCLYPRTWNPEPALCDM